jgi:hypothetical protein
VGTSAAGGIRQPPPPLPIGVFVEAKQLWKVLKRAAATSGPSGVCDGPSVFEISHVVEAAWLMINEEAAKPVLETILPQTEICLLIDGIDEVPST